MPGEQGPKRAKAPHTPAEQVSPGRGKGHEPQGGSADNQGELRTLYVKARTALAAGDYDSARDLLRRIVLADENYKDASRLLADLVGMRRRRWYRDFRIWIGGGLLMLVIVAVVLMTRGFLSPAFPSTTAGATGGVFPPAGEPSQAPTMLAPTSVPSPVPMAWKRLNAGELLPRGRVTTIAVDPRDPDVLFVGMQNAGIYKSIDGAVSWGPVHVGLGHASIDAMVIDPSDPQTIYAGVSGEGVYKTTDGAEHWARAGEPLIGHISAVVIDPADTRHLYYAGGDIFESNDAGETWHRTRPSPAGKTCPANLFGFAIHPADPTVLFAVDDGGYPPGCAQGGLYQSTDSGRTWKLIEEARAKAMAIDQATGDHIYLTTHDGWLHRSSDGGKTWEHTPVVCDALALDPKNGEIVYCGTEGGLLQVSPDGGATWGEPIELGRDMGATIATIVLPAQGEGAIYIGGRGLLKSVDGGVSWRWYNSGLGASLLDLRIAPGPSGALYLGDVEGPVGAGGWRRNSILRSTDGGLSWVAVSEEASSWALDADGTTVYRVWGTSVLRSSDGGETWTGQVGPSGSPETLSAHPTIPGTLYLYGWDKLPVYVTDDGGAAWVAAEGLPSGIKGGWLTFGGASGQVGYLAGYESVFRSDDRGRSWTARARPEVLLPGSGSQLAIDPRSADRILLATQGRGVLVSEDGGQGWVTTNMGLENLFVNTLAIDPKNPDKMYAGADGGAYVSFDGGARWGEINDGLLGATVVYSIAVDPQSNVYAATPYGVFVLEPK